MCEQNQESVDEVEISRGITCQIYVPDGCLVTPESSCFFPEQDDKTNWSSHLSSVYSCQGICGRCETLANEQINCGMATSFPQQPHICV